MLTDRLTIRQIPIDDVAPHRPSTVRKRVLGSEARYGIESSWVRFYRIRSK